MELGEFTKALCFIVGGLIFGALGLTLAYFIAPRRPNEKKITSYECGELPQGEAFGQINIRYYVMGLVFLIFDVELILLFPWAVVFTKPELVKSASSWVIFAAIEGAIFITVLLFGLIYVWLKGDINWAKSQTSITRIFTGTEEKEYSRFLNQPQKKN